MATVNVYASAADLAAALGGVDATELADKLATAIIAASQWVGHRVGATVAPVTELAPYTLAVVACEPAWRAATIVVAVRVFKAPDVPFGIMQTGEYGTWVKSRIPEAEIILAGHRTWGIG